MAIWRISDTRDDLTPLSQRGGHTELVAVAMQIFDALCYRFPLEVLPWAAAYPISRIDGRVGTARLCAQIRAPGFPARSVALRQLLAMPVGAFEPTKISTLANPCTRDKEGHTR
jgi:hypothetical protein